MSILVGAILMTNDEKRRLAVKRELAELSKTVASFDKIVDTAKFLANDMTQAAERMHKINDDARIDLALSDLDEVGKRGIFGDVKFPCAHRWETEAGSVTPKCIKCQALKPMPYPVDKAHCAHLVTRWKDGKSFCASCGIRRG